MELKGRTFPDKKVTTQIKKDNSYGPIKEINKPIKTDVKNNKNKTKKEELSISEQITIRLNQKYCKKD